MSEKNMIYDPLSAVWDALVKHRANLEKLLDKYGDQVVPPIRGNCFTVWKAIRPYLRTQWKGSSASDWERKRTVAKLLMNLRGTQMRRGFLSVVLMNIPQAAM